MVKPFPSGYELVLLHQGHFYKKLFTLIDGDYHLHNLITDEKAHKLDENPRASATAQF